MEACEGGAGRGHPRHQPAGAAAPGEGGAGRAGLRGARADAPGPQARAGRVRRRPGADAARRASGCAPRDPDADWLFLLEHPPVLTLGRGADAGNVVASPAWLEAQGFEIHETDRGGDVTYHGPGQVVAYPVVDLSAKARRPEVRGGAGGGHDPDLRRLGRRGRTPPASTAGPGSGRGRWGPSGVHLSRWISTHGLAFNADADLAPLRGHRPLRHRRSVAGRDDAWRPSCARAGRAAPALGGGRGAAGRPPLRGAASGNGEDGDFDLHTISVTATRADGKVLLLRRSEERGGFWQQVTGCIEPGRGRRPRRRAASCGRRPAADVPVRPLGYVHGFALGPAQAARVGGGLRTGQETAFAALAPRRLRAVPLRRAPRVGLVHRRPRRSRGSPWAGLRRAVRLAATGAGPRVVLAPDLAS